MHRTLRGVVGYALMVSALAARSGAVDLGDPAPTLQGVKQWLNGAAVEPSQADEKTLYVIEFWGTWWGPCRTTIPHLNELHHQLKDRNVVFVGVTYEDEAKVAPFMADMKMDYRVALDTERSTEDTWMKDVEGIPHAFIVDRSGKVVWSGHPMDGLDEALNELLEGTFDPEKMRKQREREGHLMQALQSGDLDQAARVLDEMLATDAQNLELAQMKAALLFQAGDFTGLTAHYQAMLKNFNDSAEGLNAIAWMLSAPSPMPLHARDPGVAWAAARRAAELSERKDPAILDTLALVLFNLGLMDQAIATQEEAIARASNAEEKAEMERPLAYYEASRKLAAEVSQSLAATKSSDKEEE